ncbi:MAG: hypothetical protein AAB316_20700, partial [Bacteroidota bacterium]
MPKFILILTYATGLTFATQKATAQWDIYSNLFGQMDTTLFNQYFGNLGELDASWGEQLPSN